MDGRIDKRISRSTNEGAEIGKERLITLEPRERERERERESACTLRRQKRRKQRWKGGRKSIAQHPTA